MNIHEYQAKEVIAKYGASVPQGFVAKTVDEAIEAAKKLPGDVCVVKAQIHAGGRGKGGGVKVSKGIDEVKENASNILGMQLVTKQTGPEGKKVKTLLIEEGMQIKKELYFSITTDRASQQVCLVASTEGGMNQGFVVMPFLSFRCHPAAVEQEPTSVAFTSDHGDSLKRAGFFHQHLAFKAVADASMVLINPATHALLCCFPSAWDPMGCGLDTTDSVQCVDEDQI